MNSFSNILQNIRYQKLPEITVRWWERRQYKRRYGYKSSILEHGETLPRLPKDPRPIPKYALPTYKPKNSWNERRALFGQNDYIDILGDGSIKPIYVMKEVPVWLRGFQGNELQMLLRKRIVNSHLEEKRPETFNKMNKRIKFLYKVFNHRTPSNN